MDNILEIIDVLEHSNVESVLATVIKVEGSAYRKEGTTMLFMENKRQVGVISAGCLETDLEFRALELLGSHSVQSCTIVYDLSSEDDLSWGRGAGCNGKVHVLLQKISPEMRRNLSTVKQYLHKGIGVISLNILDDDLQVQKSIFVTDEHHYFGDEQILSNSSIHSVLQGGSRIQYVDQLKQNVYIHHFKPKPRVFIFGAGLDVRPLAMVAAQVGFHVCVWDWRIAYCKENYFPNATILQGFNFVHVFEKITFMPRDSIVIMTHDFQKDKDILNYCLENLKIGYLGILGPRKRTSRLLNGKEIPLHVHSPVGLPIKADGPEEIAISIVAELIQSQRMLP